MTRLLLFFGLSILVIGCGDSPDEGDPSGAAPAAEENPAAARPEGHRRMLEILAGLAERVMDEDPFLGDVELRSYRRELEELPPSADAFRRAYLELSVGEHELRLGRTDEGIALMQQALETAARLPAAQKAETEPTILMRLAVAWLRWGENRNCVTQHNVDSCIMPFRGGGIHVDREGSERAVEILRRTLTHPAATASQQLEARWLLNVAMMTLGRYPDGVEEKWRIPPETFASGQDFPRFYNVAEDIGLATFSLSGGAVVEDLDGDEDLDVVVSTWDRTAQMRFLRNQGDGTFVDATREAGLLGLRGGLNLVHADYDNDGDFDIFVTRGAWMGKNGGHPNSLLRNDGGVFTDVAFEVGLGEVHYPTQAAAFADYDLDGDLDLYVGNEAVRDQEYPSQLFRNDGPDGFVDVAREAGVQNFAYSKGVAWGDYDGDGDPDLYVSNLWTENRLYRNRGDGRFEDVAKAIGVARPRLSFPPWFWDYDNDGALDLYVAAFVEDLAALTASHIGRPFKGEPGRLYRGDGRGGFTDMTAAVGLKRIVTTMGCGFGDLDNDGWLDFYLGTGFPAYEALLPNAMYRNREGRAFVDVTTAGGFGHVQKGHAVCFADVDNDGDQDVFQQMGGAYRGDGFQDVLFSNPGFGRSWIKLRLRGTRTNRAGLGARIRLDFRDGDTPRTIYRHVGAVASFGSTTYRQEIGLGAAKVVDRLEVRWPVSGETRVYENVPVGRLWEVGEDADQLREIPFRSFPIAPK